MILGTLLATLGSAMMVPALYDLAVGNDDWIVFGASAALTLFIGIALVFANRGPVRHLAIREAFLLTTLAWLVVTVFGAIPFTWSSLGVSYTDAFFEAMSGITTTGSTVFSGLDKMPPGILLWRALLQWLGGLGIIVMAIAILPTLQVGGMQLFRVEAFETSGKLMPRATQISGWLVGVYVGATALCALAYFLAGMDLFDAVIHAMTTLATGGYSTHDASLGYYDSVLIEVIAVVFMCVGSLPFLLYVQSIDRGPGVVFGNSQVRWFFALAGIFTLLAWLSQAGNGHRVGWLELRDAAFAVVSLMTGTGYTTVDYMGWGPFATSLLFFVTFVGGCYGSTACGIKIFRLQVVVETVRVYLLTFMEPHRVVTAHFDGKPMAPGVARSVMNYFFLFAVVYVMAATALELYGLDVLTAMSAVATALACVGPGLGSIVGPAGNFASLPDGVKWILVAAMLLGRLELFAVLVIFSPAFWRS